MTATVAAEPALFEHSYTTREVCDRAAITFRQVNHWVTRGYLRPDDPHPGNGYHRGWPLTEVRVAVLMGRLTAAGLTVAAAATAARHVVDATPLESVVEVRVPLAAGLDLVVRP